MTLIVESTFGEAPDDPAELARAYIEAEWLERWRAGLLAHEILIRLIGRS